MDKTALDIRSGLSALRMAEDVKAIIAHAPRHAGTENEHKAAEYIENQFKTAGLTVRTDRVEGICDWKLNDCRVRVVEPVLQDLTSIALLGSGATPPEGITAELIYVGKGTVEDFASADVTGKLVMRDPPRALMLDNASDETAPQGPTEMMIHKGAAGFVEHSRLPGKILQMPLLSGPEGLPVPAVAVTYEDGQYLKELIREWYAVPKGFKRTEEYIPVKLNIRVDAVSKPGYGINVMARIEGESRPDEIICLTAHHDNANGPGACDNATATAVNLETARILAALPRPERTIEFFSPTGEEYGEVGSDAYVKKYVQPDPSKYKGCIVLDIIGNGDHLHYVTESVCLGKLVKNDPDLNKKLVQVSESLGYLIEPTPLEYASDDGPFILAGVPTSYLAKLISPSWPWLHTYMDDFSVVDVNGLAVVAEITANTMWQIANE
jgi:putative aminopeptidase FrvX